MKSNKTFKQKGSNNNFVITNFDEKVQDLPSTNNFFNDINNNEFLLNSPKKEKVNNVNHVNHVNNVNNNANFSNKDKMKKLGASMSDNQLKAIEINRRFLNSRAFKFLSYKEKTQTNIISHFPFKKLKIKNKKIKSKFDRCNTADNADNADNSFVKKSYRMINNFNNFNDKDLLDKDHNIKNMDKNDNNDNSFEEEVATLVKPINDYKNIFLTADQPLAGIDLTNYHKKLKTYQDLFGDNLEDAKFYNEVNLVPFTLLEPTGYIKSKLQNPNLEENARKLMEDPDFLIKLSRPMMNKTNANFNNFMTNKGVKKGYSQKKMFKEKLETLKLEKEKKVMGDTHAYFYHKDDNLTQNLAPMKKLLTTDNFYRNKLNLEKITNEIGIMTTESSNDSNKINRVDTLKNLISNIVNTPQTTSYNVATILHTAETINRFQNSSITKAIFYKTFNTRKKFEDLKHFNKNNNSPSGTLTDFGLNTRIKMFPRDDVEDKCNKTSENFYERAKLKTEILRKKMFGITNFFNIGVKKQKERENKHIKVEEEKKKVRKLTKEDLMYNTDHLNGPPRHLINQKAQEKFVRNKEKKLVDTLYKIIDKDDIEKVFNRNINTAN